MAFLKNISRNELPDKALADLFRTTGDMEVLATLFQRYMDLLYGVCLKYLKQPETAKDAVMQIFEELVQKLPKHEVDNFKSWLYTLAKNHCLMQLRTPKNLKTVEFKTESMQLEEDVHLNGILAKEENLQKMDMKVVEKKKRYTVAYIWNLLLATFLLTKADAQVCPPKKPLTTQAPDNMIMGKIAMPVEEVVVQGTVIDSTDGKPIPDAYIMIKGVGRGTTTDNAGNFKISLERDKPVELVVSYVGYTIKTIAVHKNTPLTVVLSRDATSLMGEVVVVGYPRTSCRGLVGRVSTVKKVPIPEKIKRTVNEWLPKKEMKAFPNPAIRGNSIQVSLAVQQTGTYKLELIDAAGKVMMVQAVQMPDKTRTVSILTNEVWSAGVYWIRVSGQHVKNVYQAKVLLK